MNNKIRRHMKKASMIYTTKGVKNLASMIGSAVITKAKFVGLPIIYSNRLLYRAHHPKLTTVFLELTNNCNLRCEMCNWQARRKAGYISKQLFESCINQFSEMKVNVLNLQFGGESLLHPNFKDFLKYAIYKRDEGKIGSVGLTDNGMLFNESIADLVISLRMDWVNFSLDGLGPVNDSIRLGSKYSVIENNIKYLLAKRGPVGKPKVLLNMVDHGKTEDQKLAFYNAWVDFVDEIELIPSILPDNTWENKDALSQKLGSVPPPSFCTIPLETIVVCWDGKVTACCFDTTSKLLLGNASKESIKQIWYGSKFRNFRKAVVTNCFTIDSPCHNCEFWKINFEPRYEPILNGKAITEYSHIYRRIRKKF